MRNYSYNWGKLLFIRWFIASWLLHGVHVFDKTEKLLYILFEVTILLLLWSVIFVLGYHQWWIYALFFVILHTITWLADSHWLVGYREVNKNFKGKGIESVITFSELVLKTLSKYPSIKFIGLYGSMCRHMYHDRSDLDLRVLQEGISLKVFWQIQKLRFIGIWRYKIPLDLKLVDSIEYLIDEMREDEKPIVIYKAEQYIYNEGASFSCLKDNPKDFLKVNTLAKDNENP